MMAMRECSGAKVLDNLSQEDLDNLKQARESGITWRDIATALTNAGWQVPNYRALSWHYRGACACARRKVSAEMASQITFGAPPAVLK